MKRFIKKFRYGEKGFTLIELLVVIAILGVLSAVAIPNVGKFLGKGKTEAASTELHNVQTAAMAAMADASVGTILDPIVRDPPYVPAVANFGNTPEDQLPTNNKDVSAGKGLDGTWSTADDITVGNFIVGGKDKVQGAYEITRDGTVYQVSYPGTP
jgi:type IV pilus assembly protein PilA